jgi:hypothetical protein
MPVAAAALGVAAANSNGGAGLFVFSLRNANVSVAQVDCKDNVVDASATTVTAPLGINSCGGGCIYANAAANLSFALHESVFSNNSIAADAMEAVVNGSNYNGGGSLYLQSGETIRAQFATGVRFTEVRYLLISSYVRDTLCAMEYAELSMTAARCAVYYLLLVLAVAMSLTTLPHAE